MELLLLILRLFELSGRGIARCLFHQFTACRNTVMNTLVTVLSQTDQEKGADLPPSFPMLLRGTIERHDRGHVDLVMDLLRSRTSSKKQSTEEP